MGVEIRHRRCRGVCYGNNQLRRPCVKQSCQPGNVPAHLLYNEQKLSIVKFDIVTGRYLCSRVMKALVGRFYIVTGVLR